MNGIDVSHYQQGINWGAVRASGVEFAYVKATEGSGYTDGAFRMHTAGARLAGIKVGAYHFGHPDSSAALQAEFFHTVAGDLDLPPVLDIESTFGQSPPTVTAWSRAFLVAADSLFARPCWLYSDGSFVRANLGSQQLAAYWYARYGPVMDPPPGWTPSIWQYADHGVVPGIPGNGVDLDRWVGTPAAYQTFLGIAAPAPPHTTTGDVDVIVVRDGTGKAVLTNGVYKKAPADASEAAFWLRIGIPNSDNAADYARAVTLPSFP